MPLIYILFSFGFLILIVMACLIAYIIKLKKKEKILLTNNKETPSIFEMNHTTQMMNNEDMCTIAFSQQNTCVEESTMTQSLPQQNISNTSNQDKQVNLPSLKEGDLLNNKYRVESILGSGAQGCVYVCTNIELGNQWAVKHFNGSLNEKEILVKLNHVSLPKIADLFEDKRGTFIIESLIEGKSLDELLKEGEIFQEKDVINWMIQLCEALHYIHNKNILHMDIKPKNVLITEDSKAVLIDFGIAIYKEDNEDYKVFGYSPVFSSPEQENGINKVDERTDLYAIGATFYYLFTKNSPKIKIDIKNFSPFLSDEFASIIHRCLETNIENRFYSANDLKVTLLNLQNKNTRINKNTTIHIGVIGTCVGVGVTHTSLLFAKVLSQQKYKTAIVEMTDNNCFNHVVDNEKEKDDDVYITMNDIDFYKYQENPLKLHILYNKNYDYIIYDFGSMTFFGEDITEKKNELKQKNFTEFLRCDKKVIAVGLQLWQIDGVKLLYERKEIINNKNFALVFPLVEGEKDFKKEFNNVMCYNIPCCEPFTNNKTIEKVIKNIIT